MEHTFYQMITRLNGYQPKEKHFTSKEEVEHITEILHLKELSALDLQNLRDMVVMVYDNKMGIHPENRWEIMTSLQSITAVIDHEMYNR